MRARSERRGAVWVLCLVAAGCESAPASAPADAAAAAPMDAADATPMAAVVDAGNGCVEGTGMPGAHTLTLSLDGRERTFLVSVPDTYDRGHPAPVVFNFHGFGDNARNQAAGTGMVRAAGARGYIAVHPTGDGNAWNAGGCCPPATFRNSDDVRLVRDMIARIGADWCIDRRRVYATGLSNGGMFSHRLACDLADQLAAVASVAGTNLTRSCAPSRPIPVFHIHGTSDPTVPYEGRPPGFTSVATTVDDWATRNQCTDEPTEDFRMGSVRCESRRRCAADAEVRLCTIEGGAHVWPTGATFAATAAILDFFDRHPRMSP